MIAEVALTPVHKRRLARLARECACEPQDLLDDVFRFGFDFVERDIRESNASIADLEAGKGVPHEQVMNESRAIIARHGRRQTAAT